MVAMGGAGQGTTWQQWVELDRVLYGGCRGRTGYCASIGGARQSTMAACGADHVMWI